MYHLSRGACFVGPCCASGKRRAPPLRQ